MVADIFKKIKIISITIDCKINKFIEKYNVTFRQVKVLRYIAKNEGCSQKELEEYFHLTAATLSGVISRLENNRLVSRTPSTDKRKNKIVITHSGEKLLKEVSIILKDIDESILDSINLESLEMLNENLSILLGKVEDLEYDQNVVKID